MADLENALCARPLPDDVSDFHLGRGAVVRLWPAARRGPDHRVQRLDARAGGEGAGDEAPISLNCGAIKLSPFLCSSASFIALLALTPHVSDIYTSTITLAP